MRHQPSSANNEYTVNSTAPISRGIFDEDSDVLDNVLRAEYFTLESYVDRLRDTMPLYLIGFRRLRRAFY